MRRRLKKYGGQNRTGDRPFVGKIQGEPGLVNLAGYYDYLSSAYYISQDYENEGEHIRPSCKEMLDAYVSPMFLEKAKLAGLPVPEYYLSNGHFEPPAIVDPINPFTLKGRIVLRQGKAKSIAKSLTRNFTYAICCQELPPASRVQYFRSVLGWSTQPQYRDVSSAIWREFGIPLALVRLIRTQNGEYLFSDISPLFIEDLRVREIKYIEERVTWVS